MNTSRKTTSAEAGQLTLTLPGRRPLYDRASFLISSANEAASRTVEAWLNSGEPFLIVCGPKGAGKTHLAHLAVESEGAFFDWTDAAAAQGPAVVVFDNLPPDRPREFLRAIEEIADCGKRIVLVGEGHPSEWAKGFKDLRTRLEAMPRASLGEPDESLIRAVLAKGFLDRQLTVPPAVIDYTAPRLPRTFEAVRAFIDAADELSLGLKKKISIQLAQKTLTALFETELEG